MPILPFGMFRSGALASATGRQPALYAAKVRESSPGADGRSNPTPEQPELPDWMHVHCTVPPMLTRKAGRR